jgi:hypothetical protein
MDEDERGMDYRAALTLHNAEDSKPSQCDFKVSTRVWEHHENDRLFLEAPSRGVLRGQITIWDGVSYNIIIDSCMVCLLNY